MMFTKFHKNKKTVNKLGTDMKYIMAKIMISV